MTPPELDVAHAVLPLLQVSLSYRDHFQRIRVLSPIREYVNTRYQLSIELFNPLLAYHAKIAEFCSETYNTDARQQMFDRVTPQLENLQSVFDQGLKVPRLADETSQVVLSFSRYFAENWEDRVLPLVERSLSQARAAGNRKLEGQLLHWRGAHKSDPEQLKEALAIFQHLGYRLGQIEVLTSLSRNLVAYAKLSEAESSIDQAYELIDKDTPVRQIIRVHITRATLQHSRGRFVESVRAARKSLTLDPHASVHSRSTLHNVLADCYLYLGYHRQAAYHSRVGIAYSLSADGIPSQRYDSLGDCLLTMSRVSEARAAYFKAYEGFVSINATNWAAAVLRNSARTFVHQGRYTEALQQFQLSLATFDFGLHAGDTKVAYGDLYLRMGDHATAWRYYADARANFLRPECIEVWNKHLWMAVMHMGDIKLEEGCLDEARNFFVVALAQCKKYRIKLGVAQCIQRLGDLQWKTDDLLLPDAESCYIVTREILEALDANRHMADVVLRIALVKLWRGEVEASSDALQQAMKLYELAEDEQGKGFVQKVIEDCRAKQPDEVLIIY
jgi:tetratricopeptide (TPR) repeat protein